MELPQTEEAGASGQRGHRRCDALDGPVYLPHVLADLTADGSIRQLVQGTGGDTDLTQFGRNVPGWATGHVAQSNDDFRYPSHF